MLVPGSTKEFIFDTAITLFGDVGYDAVSIRDIATGVGIKGASIYNHYDSKQEILDHIYEFYRHHMFCGRTSDERIARLVESGSLEALVEALAAVRYSLLDEQLGRRMMAISKIIYSRMLSGDQIAAGLYVAGIQDGMAMVRTAVNYGVELGRFRSFEVEGFANSFVALYTHMAIEDFIKPVYVPLNNLSKESQINHWICKLLSLIEKEEYRSKLEENRQKDHKPGL